MNSSPKELLENFPDWKFDLLSFDLNLEKIISSNPKYDSSRRIGCWDTITVRTYMDSGELSYVA